MSEPIGALAAALTLPASLPSITGHAATNAGCLVVAVPPSVGSLGTFSRGRSLSGATRLAFP